MNNLWTMRHGQKISSNSVCLVGILNVTPDSFSDGGLFFEKEKAIRHGIDLLDAGAGMLDIGAESTRPFAEAVGSAEESARLLPVLQEIRSLRPHALLSVDTFRAETARKALEAGANVINDISACRFDPALLDVLAEYKPGYVLMHSQGTPAEMQKNPHYGNVVEEILHFFAEQMHRLTTAGLPEENIVLDPGIGFGKTAEHTLAILQNLENLQTLGRPLYIGLSRKSFFGTLFKLAPDAREEAVHLAVTLLAERSICYQRVHDVAGCAQALRMLAVFGKMQ